MLKVHRPQKIELRWEEPEVQQCTVCGQDYHDWQIVKDNRLIEMCLNCSHPKRALRMQGVRFGYFFEYDNDHSSIARLLCRQASQLAAAIQRLEDESR